MRVIACALLVCLTACGRIAFDGQPTGDGGAVADGAISTGPLGPRWLATFSATNAYPGIAGANGQVALVTQFTGTFTADRGVSLTGNGFTSSALLRFDATGNVLGQAVLDASGFCDMRGVALDGSDLIVAGFTGGTTAVPAYGACSVVTNRQDPIVLRIDGAGTQAVVAHWTASAANAQSWSIALMPDRTLMLAGIYGGGLQIGSAALPAAGADPNAWFARTTAGSGAAWSHGFSDDTQLFAGPIDADGDETCLLGSHTSAATVFGTALPFVGGYDAWIARIDGGGAPRFVRAIGSPGNESNYGEGAIRAEPGGGCIAGLEVPGDVTLGGTLYPASDGGGLLVRFATDGTIAAARRYPSAPQLTIVGGRLIVAFAVASPIAIGGTTYTPMGVDTVVVEVGATDRLLGAVGGAGDQVPTRLVGVGPDAVAFVVTSTGALTFGATSVDTGTTMVNAVGVLGV